MDLLFATKISAQHYQDKNESHTWSMHTISRYKNTHMKI